MDLDAVFDIDKITSEQVTLLNVGAKAYGMQGSDYIRLDWHLLDFTSYEYVGCINTVISLL